MENKNKAPTEAEIEAQIRANISVVRRKRLSREKLEAECRKYDNIYHACVLDGGITTGPYIWREVYRRVLCTNE